MDQATPLSLHGITCGAPYLPSGKIDHRATRTKRFQAKIAFSLLTRGYNTCYCNNIAPGETTRTCRKVGAHAKEKREREEASPVQREYQRTYNRLKRQRQRRKKDDTEYNRQVAQAQDIRDAYALGALDEEDAIARLIAIK